MTSRVDGRTYDQIRDVRVELNVQSFPEGSLIYQCGGTKVLVAVSVKAGVRDFLKGTGKGWVTAEYEMHPRANKERKDRERSRRNIDGRTQEIQRLIGRTLRSVVTLEKLGERTLHVDCDVLDADGGTRTAAITGGWIGLAMALHRLRAAGEVGFQPMLSPLSAISVGLVGGIPMVDLCYQEDSRAEVDLNLVATPRSEIVEIQATAEQLPVSRAQMDVLVDIGLKSTQELWDVQRRAIESAGVDLQSLVQHA